MTMEELILHVIDRPDMYLRETTLSCFDAFLSGWRVARDDWPSKRLMYDFHHWVADHYGMPSSFDWAKLVGLHSRNDVVALSEAFSLFKEFLKQRCDKPQPSDHGCL